jgi:hypothetical protein
MTGLTQHIQRTLTNHFKIEIKAYWEENVINALLPDSINADEAVEIVREIIIGGNVYVGETAIGNVLVVEL